MFFKHSIQINRSSATYWSFTVWIIELTPATFSGGIYLGITFDSANIVLPLIFSILFLYFSFKNNLEWALGKRNNIIREWIARDWTDVIIYQLVSV